MESYYLVSYNHATKQWGISVQEQLDLMPDGTCRQADDEWFTPAWGTPEQSADGDAFLALYWRVASMNYFQEKAV